MSSKPTTTFDSGMFVASVLGPAPRAQEETPKAKKYDSGKPPVVQGFFKYFPRAIKSVAMLSLYGITKYETSFKERNFAGLEAERLEDAEGRHILDQAIDGDYDPESGLLHKIHKAWEAMADLEVTLTKMDANGIPYRIKGKVDW
jgi:hypothetical protein